jgi:hypothetical protein
MPECIYAITAFRIVLGNSEKRADCCARAASGHAAAAPPRSVAKNFRRPMWLAM